MKPILRSEKGVPAKDPAAKAGPISARLVAISSREMEPLVEQEHALQACLDDGLRLEDEDHSPAIHHVLEIQLQRVTAGISQLELGFALPSRPASSSPASRPSMTGGWQGMMPTPGQRRLADLVARHSALRRTLGRLAQGRPEAVQEKRILKSVARSHAEMASRLTALLRGEASDI